jgi:hypothetical protein
VLEAFVAAVGAAVGAWWLRGAVSTWRGGRPLSSHPLFRVQPTRRKGHIDRCSLPVAIAELCWALTIFCAIFLPAGPAKPAPVVSAGIALSAVGAAIAAGCAVTIRYSRHPRFLIPPPLRSAGEPWPDSPSAMGERHV